MATLSKHYPQLTGCYIQADNAGCYHSFETILGSAIRSSGSIKIKKFIFSEAQDGKNICDRTLATKKGLLKDLVNNNQGDIVNARNIKEHLTWLKKNRAHLKSMETFSSVKMFLGSVSRKSSLNVHSSIKISKYSEFTLHYNNKEIPVKITAQEQSNYGASLDIEVLYAKTHLKKNTILITDIAALQSKLTVLECEDFIQESSLSKDNGSSVFNSENLITSRQAHTTITGRQSILFSNTLLIKCNDTLCIKRYSRQRDADSCHHRYK